MKIYPISMVSVNNVYSTKKVQQTEQNANSQVSFGESYKDSGALDLHNLRTLNEIRTQELNKIIEEMNAISASDESANSKRASYISRISAIKREYELTNELLNQSKGSNRGVNFAIIAKYFENRSKMAPDEGFNQLVGYDSIKNKLREHFCIDIFLRDKLIQDDKKVNVPDVVFFYGPTGTGKTTFAKALAEETQSRIVDLDLTSAFDNEEKINIIQDELKKSLNNYESDGLEKTRTIILINEGDSLIKQPNVKRSDYSQQSEVVTSFLELVRNCSEKYKCTVFITTNEPLRVDPRILDKKVTPIKVAVGPCSQEVAKEILDKEMKKYGVSVDSAEVAREMFKNRNYRFSNSNIVNLVETVLKSTSSPTLDDFIYYISDEDSPIIPGIQPRDMEKFETAKRYLRDLTDKEWQDL